MSLFRKNFTVCGKSTREKNPHNRNSCFKPFQSLLPQHDFCNRTLISARSIEMVVASDFRNSHHIILNNNKVMLSDNIMVLIPVFFVLLLGYFAGRAKKFDADQVAGINELVLDFALPASLFTRIVSSSRTEMRLCQSLD